jgi:hypothetical protein
VEWAIAGLKSHSRSRSSTGAIRERNPGYAVFLVSAEIQSREDVMRTKSQRALIQLGSILAVGLLVAIILAIWRLQTAQNPLLTDTRSIVLNIAILVLFAFGVGRVVQALIHYAREEKAVERFDAARDRGASIEAALDETEADSLIARRCATIRELFQRRVPIDHGAISAITIAEESLFQSFPRFVNNVLILTGVFGTVISLIFALVGASEVLKAALPGEGMGTMLLGMNTALTTTATAIICYFFFTFFFQKLSDVQTYVFSQIERSILLHVVPEYIFESEAINHETKRLILEVRGLVATVGSSLGHVEEVLTGLNEHNAAQLQRWEAVLVGQQEQSRRVDAVLARLDEVARVLREGFRLQ